MDRLFEGIGRKAIEEEVGGDEVAILDRGHGEGECCVNPVDSSLGGLVVEPGVAGLVEHGAAGVDDVEACIGPEAGDDFEKASGSFPGEQDFLGLGQVMDPAGSGLLEETAGDE